MLLAVVAGNVGVMWVAVEATTIITTFLVGYRARGEPRGVVEVRHHLLGRIALAFLGTVLVYLRVARRRRHSRIAAVDVAHECRTPLDPGVMRLALALLVLGYGTKVGLAPCTAGCRTPTARRRPRCRR